MRQPIKGGEAKPDVFLVALGALWLIVALILGYVWAFQRPSIKVSWNTESEFGSAGFNVLRSEAEDGPFQQVNNHLIPGSDDPAAGAEYVYVDAAVSAGRHYYYQLEDVEADGDVSRHELVAAQAPDRPYWLLIVSVLLAVGGAGLLYLGLSNLLHRVTTNARTDS